MFSLVLKASVLTILKFEIFFSLTLRLASVVVFKCLPEKQKKR